MALNSRFAEANCPHGHKSHGPEHQQPKVDGKPFQFADHKAEYERLGLCGYREACLVTKTGPPPGKPVKINGADVYPALHFA